MKMIHEPRKIRQVEYFAVFYYEDGLSGFRFPCNKFGEAGTLSDLQAENYERCLSHDLNVEGPFIEKEEITFSTAGIYICECGQELLNQEACPVCHNLALAS